MLGWSTLNQALRFASSQMTVSRGAYSSGTARCAGDPATSTSTVRTVVADTAGESVFTQFVGGYMSIPSNATRRELNVHYLEHGAGSSRCRRSGEREGSRCGRGRAGESGRVGRDGSEPPVRAARHAYVGAWLADPLGRRGAPSRQPCSWRPTGEEPVAGVVVRAADGVDRIGSYLQQQNGDELLRDVERFARRRPWLTAGVAMVAGVALSRFLKSSSEERYRAAGGQEGNGSTAAGSRGLCPGALPATAAAGAGARAEW